MVVIYCHQCGSAGFDCEIYPQRAFYCLKCGEQLTNSLEVKLFKEWRKQHKDPVCKNDANNFVIRNH